MSLVGARVGKYRVTRQLGRGGMAAVYVAEHVQIGKQVAIKVLHPELASNETSVARFFHEARVVNAIAHPNIVDILDCDTIETADGPLVCLTMELLAGETLGAVIRRGPLEPSRAVRIARQIADALHASHERGVIHRDLKPDNVMVLANDAIKLLDFGIAKLDIGGPVTRFGVVLGTPMYMSPEQCEGSLLDRRSDIYALGVVMFEMLTGRAPFPGAGFADVLAQHRHAPVPKMRGVSAMLVDVVERALAKDPDARFATMRELAGALGSPARHAGVAAITLVDRPSFDAMTTIDASAGESIEKTAPRRRPGFVSAAVATIAIIIGASVAAYTTRGGSEPEPPIVAMPAIAPAAAPLPPPPQLLLDLPRLPVAPRFVVPPRPIIKRAPARKHEAAIASGSNALNALIDPFE